MFENKSLIIHIAAEIIIITGITFYFSQKNKKTLEHINDLIQRIEDQEDIIQKHEQLITNLTNALNELNNKISHISTSSVNILKMPTPKPTEDNIQKNKKKSPVTGKKNKNISHENIDIQKKPVDVQFHFIPAPNMNNFIPNSMSSKVEEIFDNKELEEDNENLDSEILEELEELEELDKLE